MDIEQIKTANLRIPDGKYTSSDFITQQEFNELYSVGATQHLRNAMYNLIDTKYPGWGGCIIQRLLSKTQGLLNDNECWLCNRYINATGYLHLQNGKNCYKKSYGHRIVFTKFYNIEVPKKIHVRHRCDNRNCWNPIHLHLGTCKDNISDIKYRTGNMRGGYNSIDLDILITIKQLLATNMTPNDISYKVGIPAYTIRHIKNGLYYDYVDVSGDKVTIIPPSFTET